MKKTILAVLVVAFLAVALTILFQRHFAAQDTHTEVANRLIELINAGDYRGVQNLFNNKMSQALPQKKATEFFTGLTAQFGKVHKLGEPTRNAGWTIFAAHCERGTLDLSLALDDESKIAGLTFKPRDAEKKPTITEVANRLVELINAGEYHGVQNLFNNEMSQALPQKKATEFFTGLTGQFGKVQKLGEPVRKEGWTVFPAHCERGMLDMSLALDDESKIAGLTFKPSGR
jgi:hypothetical protein